MLDLSSIQLCYKLTTKLKLEFGRWLIWSFGLFHYELRQVHFLGCDWLLVFRVSKDLYIYPLFSHHFALCQQHARTVFKLQLACLFLSASSTVARIPLQPWVLYCSITSKFDNFYTDEKIFDQDQKIKQTNDWWLCCDFSKGLRVMHTKCPSSIMVLGVVSNKGHVMPPHFFPVGLSALLPRLKIHLTVSPAEW